MFAAADVQYLPTGQARAALVLAGDATFAAITAIAGRHRMPDGLRRVDALARGR